MAKDKVSGTPDKPIIWDKDNRLVEPTLKAHFEEASKAVLRSDAEAGNTLMVDLDAPRKAQERDDMTAEPTTSPQPSSDENMIIDPITIRKPDEQSPSGVRGSGGALPSSPATPDKTPPVTPVEDVT